ncbi:MAG: DUF4833 domain-containing protein [Bacteroidales bacterium]|nr:DUF4833 domain-containing protein [Bacteroidales bacterium]MBN2757081.1 DUF4833 domain-containing protein [Bacteroidales bacterium]
MIKVTIILFFITLLNVNSNFKGNIENANKLEIPNSENNIYSKGKLVNNKKDLLFVVSHNQSPNIVIYQANRQQNGSLNTKKPVDVFWLLINKGDIIEDLNLLEWKLAYGFKIIPVIEGEKYKIKLNAIKDKIIIINKKADGKVESQMLINGKFSILKEVFINYEESFYLPQVKYLDFRGIDLNSGKNVSERLIVNK